MALPQVLSFPECAFLRAPELCASKGVKISVHDEAQPHCCAGLLP